MQSYFTQDIQYNAAFGAVVGKSQKRSAETELKGRKSSRAPEGTKRSMKHIEDDDKSSVSGSSSSAGSSPSAADSSHDDAASDAGSKKADDDGDVSMDEDDDAAAGDEEEEDADADEDDTKDASKPDVEDAKLLSKEERDALLKEEAAVLQQQRDLQSKSLEAVKQSLVQDTDWSKKTTREKKMAFLMAQVCSRKIDAIWNALVTSSHILAN